MRKEKKEFVEEEKEKGEEMRKEKGKRKERREKERENFPAFGRSKFDSSRTVRVDTKKLEFRQTL